MAFDRCSIKDYLLTYLQYPTKTIQSVATADSNDVCLFQQSSSSSSSSVIDSTFVEHMDSGLWFVSLYNDGDAPRTLAFTASPHGQFTTTQCL